MSQIAVIQQLRKKGISQLLPSFGVDATCCGVIDREVIVTLQNMNMYDCVDARWAPGGHGGSGIRVCVLSPDFIDAYDDVLPIILPGGPTGCTFFQLQRAIQEALNSVCRRKDGVPII
jgi:hypothetical protein